MKEMEVSTKMNRGIKGIAKQRLRDPITGQYVKEIGTHARNPFKRGSVSMESGPKGSRPTQ